MFCTHQEAYDKGSSQTDSHKVCPSLVLFTQVICGIFPANQFQGSITLTKKLNKGLSYFGPDRVETNAIVTHRIPKDAEGYAFTLCVCSHGGLPWYGFLPPGVTARDPPLVWISSTRCHCWGPFLGMDLFHQVSLLGALPWYVFLPPVVTGSGVPPLVQDPSSRCQSGRVTPPPSSRSIHQVSLRVGVPPSSRSASRSTSRWRGYSSISGSASWSTSGFTSGSASGSCLLICLWVCLQVQFWLGGSFFHLGFLATPGGSACCYATVSTPLVIMLEDFLVLFDIFHLSVSLLHWKYLHPPLSKVLCEGR